MTATVLGAAKALREGTHSSVALVEAALEQANARASINALAWRDDANALTQAQSLDAEARAGRLRGALHGVPITLKDLFNVAGWPTNAGTRAVLPEAFQNPSFDALAVARLRAAGAVILAKTNMHEIALGITGENVHTEDVRNPLDESRQAGGSSSGAAAATVAGIGLAALGSDTGGSVRIPASFCGCVGFKPSFGTLPLEGALHLSMTCDHAGVLTHNVADAHALTTTLAAQAWPLLPSEHLRGLRFGVPRTWLEGRLGVPLRAAFEDLLERLQRAGASVLDVAPKNLDLAGCYTPLVRAEAAFVHRAALEAGGEGFSQNVLGPLRIGQQISASDYLQARAQRRLVRDGVTAVLLGLDALLLPTAPMPAPKRGTSEVMLESSLRTHRDAFIELTLPWSLIGVPTLSLPFVWLDGLPVGLQIVAAFGQDARLLSLAASLEAWLSA